MATTLVNNREGAISKQNVGFTVWTRARITVTGEQVDNNKYKITVSGVTRSGNKQGVNSNNYCVSDWGVTGTAGINSVGSTQSARMKYNYTAWVCPVSYSANIAQSKTAKTITCYVRYSGADGLSCSASVNVTVPAIVSYTVSYDANGGSGAPSNQTKWYNENLTLSSTQPTRDGYKFVGWATSATATTSQYSSGSTYTGNANLTLYAVWVQNTFTGTLHYDANGGLGAPSDQTHVQKINSIISDIKPTRQGYAFLGWSVDKTATSATYITGGRYYNDDFSDGDVLTIYAVWIKTYPDTHIKVPDTASSIKDMWVCLPNHTNQLKAIWYCVEDLNLQTSDNHFLIDKNGNYLAVKGV